MEAVYMPYLDRKTICVSTMVGCPAKCAFCATGAMGFGRNLTPGEIVGQVLAVAGGEGIAPRELRNLVFMGMGEPLLNYANTMTAARILLHPQALGMSKRRVTLSLCGLGMLDETELETIHEAAPGAANGGRVVPRYRTASTGALRRGAGRRGRGLQTASASSSISRSDSAEIR